MPKGKQGFQKGHKLLGGGNSGHHQAAWNKGLKLPKWKMNDSGREKIRLGKLGDKNPMRRKEVSQLVGLKRRKFYGVVEEEILLSMTNREIEAGRKKPKNCEVCDKTGRICFDHNHKTGKFRGWLCTKCNLILGLAGDDPELLKKLSKYLN